MPIKLIATNMNGTFKLYSNVFPCPIQAPQVTIGRQRSVLPDVGGHCCTTLLVFYFDCIIYITVSQFLAFKFKMQVSNW